MLYMRIANAGGRGGSEMRSTEEGDAVVLRGSARTETAEVGGQAAALRVCNYVLPP